MAPPRYYSGPVLTARQLFNSKNQEETEPDEPAEMKPGKIAGAVVGGLIGSGLLLLVFGFLFFRWRRKRRERKARENDTDPAEYFAERRTSHPGQDAQPGRQPGRRTSPSAQADAPRQGARSSNSSKGERSSRERAIRNRENDLVDVNEAIFAHQHSLVPHFPHGLIGFAAHSARSSLNPPESERPDHSQSPDALHEKAGTQHEKGYKTQNQHEAPPMREAANLSYYDTRISMDTDSYEAPPEPPSRQMTEMYEAQLKESRRRRSSTSTLRRIINSIKRRSSTPSSNYRTRGQDSPGFFPGSPTSRPTQEQGWEMTRSGGARGFSGVPYLYEEPEQMAGPSHFSHQGVPPYAVGQQGQQGQVSLSANDKGKGVDTMPSRPIPSADSQVRSTTEMDPELPSSVYGARIGSTDNYYGHGLPPSAPPVSAQPPTRNQERLKSPDIPEPMDLDQAMANPPGDSFYRSSRSPPLVPGSFVDPMNIFHPSTASEKAHYTTRQIENSASPSETPMSPPELAHDQPAPVAGPSQPRRTEEDEAMDEFLDLPEDIGRQSIESYDVSTTPATAGFSTTDPSSGRTPETRTTSSPSPFPVQIKPEPDSSTSPGPSQVSPEPSSQSPSSMSHTCEECGRSFDQIHKLNHHKRYHDRKHECPYESCDKKFGTKTHLDRHINDKHVKSKAFHCIVPGCAYFKGGKAFPRKDNWRRHMMKKHGHNASTLDAMEESVG